MSELSYPLSSVYGDYARAAFGLLATAGPLLLLEPAPVLVWILAPLAALFAWFGGRTALRHVCRFELSDNAIARRGAFERRLAWDDLRRIKLAYYAPRRNRENGWMQLTLRGPGGPIHVDSTLDGFELIAGKAAAVATARDLPLDEVTAANFTALGFELERPSEAGDAGLAATDRLWDEGARAR